MKKSLGLIRMMAVVAVGAVASLGVGHVRGDVIGHWTFDELTGADHDTFAEASGHVNSDGAKLNALLADKNQVAIDASGNVPFGKAARFSGRTGAYLDLPYISGMRDHSFTIACWVNLSMNERSYVLADMAPPHLAFAFGFDPGKSVLAPHMSVAMRNDVVKTDRKTKVKSLTDIVSFRNETPVGLNTWHHVAWTWDRADEKHGTLTAYLDGAKIATASQASRVSTVNIADSKHPMKIGFKQDTESTFHGAIDELWIFDSALTDGQVTSLMKSNDIAGVQVAAATPSAAVPTAAGGGGGQVAAVIPEVGTPAPAAQGTPSTAVTAPPTAVAATPEEPATPAFLNGGNGAGNDTPAAAGGNGGGGDATAATPSTSEPVAAATPSEPVKSDFLRGAGGRSAAVTVLPTLSSVRPHRYTPGRLAGIFGSGIVAMGLSGFLFWAKNERYRMRHARR